MRNMRQSWCQILEKDEKVTLETFMLSQQEHLSVVQNFTFSLKIFSDFAILISLCIEFLQNNKQSKSKFHKPYIQSKKCYKEYKYK